MDNPVLDEVAEFANIERMRAENKSDVQILAAIEHDDLIRGTLGGVDINAYIDSIAAKALPVKLVLAMVGKKRGKLLSAAEQTQVLKRYDEVQKNKKSNNTPPTKPQLSSDNLAPIVNRYRIC